MKKGKITLGIVIGLLTIGFVVALSQGVFAERSDSAMDGSLLAAAGSGVFCLDVPGCNDVKLAYYSVGGGFYGLNGYEYGCGHEERLVDGTMRVEGDTVYIAYTSICGTTTPTPRIGQINAQLDLRTLTGTAVHAYHYDGYHTGTGTAKIIACPPASAVESEGGDVAQ